MTEIIKIPARRRNRRVVDPYEAPPALSAEPTHNADPLYDTPDWRYKVAGMLAKDERIEVVDGKAADKRYSRYLDQLIANSILPFMERYRKIKTLADRDRLSQDPRFEGLFWAMQTFEDVMPILRYRLEAMFVGGASIQDAANYLGLEENYIWWYAKMFFDVHGRLHNKRWVMDRILLSALKSGGHDGKYNLTWKLLSGLGGWEFFVNGNDGVLSPLTPEGAARINDVVRYKAAEDACLTQLTRVINRFNAVSVLEEHHRAEELDIKKKQAALEGVEDDKQKAMVLMINNTVQALSIRRADERDVPQLTGALATLFEDRTRENAERARIAEATEVKQDLSDDV